VLKEYSHASFSLVFTVNITKQDKYPSTIQRVSLQLEQTDQQLQADQAEKLPYKAPSRCLLCQSLQHNARKCPSRNTIVPPLV
jgi:hypothetical protein